MITRGVLTLVAAGVLAACGSPGARNAEWDGFRERYVEWEFTVLPAMAVYNGRHDFDGILPDLTPEGLAAALAGYRAMRDTAASFLDSQLDDARRVERDHLLSRIDGEVFWRDVAGRPWTSPAWYVGEFLSPDVYLSRPYAPLPERMRAYLTWAEAVPAALEQVRANLRLPLAWPFIRIARVRYGGLARYLAEEVPGLFAEVADEDLRREFAAANHRAAEAFARFDGWLEAQMDTATEDFRLGPDRVSQMLWTTERVDVPLETLRGVARADMDRNTAALREVCGEWMPDASLRECVDRAATFKPSGDAVTAARSQVEELERFLRSREIVSIPGEEVALVDEAPPHMRGNFAYIDIPGPFEDGLPSVYYISPPDPVWPEEERLGYTPSVGALLFISAHEVWPGHFLQVLHGNRAESLIGRVYWSYANSEGWAHYVEELMWEEGLGRENPVMRIGQLTEALKRDARFLSALGLHAGAMTLEESERLFREEAFQDAANAREQAARGTYDPAYLGYTLGKLMIRKLREDWSAARGSGASLKEFHDTFLSYGAAPVPIVRLAMLGPGGGPPL